MRTRTHRTSPPALWGMAALVLIAARAEAQTQTVEAEGLSFQAPQDWQATKPSSAMRKAQLTIPAEPGDKDKAELVVFKFPGGAGSVQANVQRWQSQFQDPNGQPPKIETATIQGKNVDVTRVETSGTFTDRLNQIGPKPNYHLLGAIVETKQAAYFLKLVGPEKTMAKVEPAFDALIKTIAVDEK